MRRRLFLKASLLTAEYGLLVGAGLLVPRNVIGEWRSDVYHATVLEDALQLITRGEPVFQSDKIHLKAPAIIEDGRSVQIGIRSELPDTDSISLFSEKNPNPALGTFRLEPGLEPSIETRIKIGGTGHVIALVHAAGGFYSARQYAKVTAGGCG